MVRRRFLIHVEDAEVARDALHSVGSEEKTLRRSTLTRYLSDRVRTIDQVKRLYAVVIGISVSNCLSSSFQAVKASYLNNSIENCLIPISEFGTFLSLVVLFYLGTERTLDIKYLDVKRKNPPTSFGLLFDLLSLGATAIMFVALADCLPDKDDIAIIIKDSGAANLHVLLSNRQYVFVTLLAFLYALDILILLCHLFNLPERRHAIRAHTIWIISNALCILLFIPYLMPKMLRPYDIYTHSISIVSSIILGMHAIRFACDYFLAFRFYYPEWVLPDSDDLFMTEP